MQYNAVDDDDDEDNGKDQVGVGGAGLKEEEEGEEEEEEEEEEVEGVLLNRCRRLEGDLIASARARDENGKLAEER